MQRAWIGFLSLFAFLYPNGFVAAFSSATGLVLFSSHSVRITPFVAPTTLNAKKGKKGKSSWEPLAKMAFAGSSKNTIESSVETVLLLTDEKRQAEWKKDMQKQFPFIPLAVLDTALSALSTAFESIAPSQLKAALKPGGLEKARPDLEDSITKALETQPVMKSIPLSPKDKQHLLKYLVGLSLDYMLKDVEEILKNPFEKLQTLEHEKKQIQKYMGFWQLAWYRIRYFPMQTALLGVTTTLLTTLLYQKYQRTAIVSAITSAMITTLSVIKGTIAKINAQLGLTPRKVVKRVARKRI